MSFLILATLKASVVLTVAAAAQLLLRRGSASLRHLIWGMALIAASIVPFVPGMRATEVALPMPVQSRIPEPQLASPAVYQAASPLATRPSKEALLALRPELPPRHFKLNVAELLGSVWLLGFAAIALSTLTSCLRARHLVRNARPIGLLDGARQVRESEDVAAPITVFRQVLLPREWIAWPEDRLRNVLLHEAAHVQRGDSNWLLAGRLCCALHWFNPLAWVALSGMRREAEASADDAVLRAGVGSSAYATDLIELARPFCIPGLGFSLSRTSGLGRRVRRIVQQGVNRQAVNVKLALVASISWLAVTSVCASVRLVSSGQETAKPVQPESNGQVTEVITPSGIHVKYLGTTDHKTTWDASGKRIPNPIFRKYATSGELRDYRALIFAYDLPANSKDPLAIWNCRLEVSPDDPTGRKRAEIFPFGIRYIEKNLGAGLRLFQEVVLPASPGSRDVVLRIQDGPWQVLTKDDVPSGDRQGEGPLHLRVGKGNPAEMKFPPSRYGYIFVKWPKESDNLARRVVLYDRNNKVVPSWMMTMSGDGTYVRSEKPPHDIARVEVETRSWVSLHFTNLPLQPK